MAVTLDEVTTYLDNQGLRYDANTEKNFIRTGFATESYLDSDGDNSLAMIIALEENGEFVKILSPRCYSCTDKQKRPAVLQTLLNLAPSVA